MIMNKNKKNWKAGTQFACLIIMNCRQCKLMANVRSRATLKLKVRAFP